MAQPGIKSFALRSIDQTRPSSPVNLLYRLFWFLADRSLQRQASLVNLRLRQLPNIRC
jgi:hypothetical protein